MKMTIREALEYLQPILDNHPMPGYAAALEAVMEAARDPIHYAGGCYCRECEYQDDCEKQVTLCIRDHVLEQNVYHHHCLEWCSYGRRREGA